MKGNNFGENSTDVTATLQGLALTVVSVAQHLIVVEIPVGTGALLALQVTVNHQNVNETISYEGFHSISCETYNKLLKSREYRLFPLWAVSFTF